MTGRVPPEDGGLETLSDRLGSGGDRSTSQIPCRLEWRTQRVDEGDPARLTSPVYLILVLATQIGVTDGPVGNTVRRVTCPHRSTPPSGAHDGRPVNWSSWILIMAPPWRARRCRGQPRHRCALPVQLRVVRVPQHHRDGNRRAPFSSVNRLASSDYLMTRFLNTTTGAFSAPYGPSGRHSLWYGRPDSP